MLITTLRLIRVDLRHERQRRQEQARLRDKLILLCGDTAYQRDLAQRMVGVSAAVGGEAIRAQTESVSAAIREQAESVKQNGHRQAIEKYQDTSKAELQDELTRRNLPKNRHRRGTP